MNQIIVGKRTLVVGFLALFGLLLTVIFATFIFPQIFAELKYPLLYEDIIIEEAKARDLDPVLVAAVIYAESHYNPKAVSPVGARGLMQLMPATATGIARRMGDTNFTLDKLFDPATNIRYGTFHLQGLMGRYDSDLEPAIVAYNGGGGAGDRYQAGNRGSVPNESLRYVQRVVQMKEIYQELYGARLTGSDPFARRTAGSSLSSQLLTAIQQAVLQRLAQP